MVVAVTHRETHEPTYLTERQDWHACVCLFMFIRAWFYWGGFSTCLFIHLPLCLCMSISLCPLCLCAEFGQHLQSFFLFVFLSSGLERIPLSLPALWSHIIPNTVKSAKRAPRVNANQIHGPVYSTHHFTVSLNPITALGLSFSLTHSFIYSFIHLTVQ